MDFDPGQCNNFWLVIFSVFSNKTASDRIAINRLHKNSEVSAPKRCGHKVVLYLLIVKICAKSKSKEQ